MQKYNDRMAHRAYLRRWCLKIVTNKQDNTFPPTRNMALPPTYP